MKSVHFFVEGIADQKFLADILSSWYSFSLDEKKFAGDNESRSVHATIEQTGGVTVFSNAESFRRLSAQFRLNLTQGTENIILIDADDDNPGRKNEVIAALSTEFPHFPFDSHLYLWPDNQSNGELETLLERIINPENQPILHCWSTFESCISQIEDRTLTLPANKTKMYAYLETLLGDSNSEKEKIKERNRDYTNRHHWNLDPTNPNLSPLKTFLDRHLLDNSITLKI